MINYKKTLLFGLAAAWLAGSAGAQTNGSNSPYSRYGFGLLADRAQSFNKGMAGVGYAYRSGSELNMKNPAAYAAIDSLSFIFDMGLSLQTANISDDGSAVNAKNTSLDYLTVGFRLRPHLGMVLGLVPYSTVGYSMTAQRTQRGENGYLEYTESNNGDGGLHEAFAGIGWQMAPFLSAGVNAGVLWGGITNTVLNNFDDANTYSLRRRYQTNIRTYRVDVGVQFYQPINKKNDLAVGVTYGLGHGIDNDSRLYSQTLSGSTLVSSDTVTARNAYGLPHTVGVGLTWTYRKRLSLSADYSYERWADVRYPQLTADNRYVAAKGAFANRHSVGVGVEYMPNPDGVRYAEHIRYRAGVRYATGYARTQNTQTGAWGTAPRSYLATVGVGIPIANAYGNRSVLSLSGQYERVQPTGVSRIAENYFRLCIGLTFNERWFMKRKID